MSLYISVVFMFNILSITSAIKSHTTRFSSCASEILVTEDVSNLGYFFQNLTSVIDLTVNKNFGHFNYFSIMFEVTRRGMKYTPTPL